MLFILTGCSLPQTFKIQSAADPARENSVLINPTGNIGAGPAQLPDVTGDFGTVEYDLDLTRHAFLVSGDVEIGTSFDQFVELPQSVGSSSVDVADLDPATPWASVKVYDAGMCSLSLPYALIPPGLQSRLEDRLNESDEVDNAEVIATRLTPTLRSVENPDDIFRTLSIDEDFIHIEFVFDADEIGRDIITCFSPRVRMAFDLRLRLDNANIQSEPSCFFPTAPGSTLPAGDDQTFDIVGEVFNIEVDVDQQPGADRRCREGVRDRIEDNLRNQIRSEFGPSVASALTSILLIRDAADLGLTPRPCRCHGQCTELDERGAPYPGRRGVCNFETEQCQVLLEPNRINLRPDRLEIVLAQDGDDIQAPLFEHAMFAGACDSARHVPAAGSPVTISSTGWPLVSDPMGVLGE
jgi:hypothetical protein